MSQLWIIYALIFGAGLLGIQGGYLLLFRDRKTNQSVNRRLELSSQGVSATAAFNALKYERGFADYDNPLLSRISDFLTQTGLRIDRNRLMLAACGLVIPFFFAFSIPLGFGIAPLVPAIFAAVTTVFLYLKIVRSRRIKRFSEQFPDTLDVIVRGVRVGLPFSSALNLVAREMPDPAGTEFGMAADEIAFGLDVPTALQNLQRRVGQEDLLYFVIAITIQIQTGGKMADLLARLSRLIRERLMLRLKIKALTSEGRLSALCLSAAPFVLFGIVSLMSPDYFTSVRNHPLIPPAVVFGFTMLLIGNVIMYRMVHFKF